jgi:hypothetical protein
MVKNFHLSVWSRSALGPLIQLVRKSIKRESMHPLPHTSSWLSAWIVKHRNKFTLPLYIYIYIYNSFFADKDNVL